MPVGLPVRVAGLVLAWPFVEAFLERCGLVVRGAFVDEASRCRSMERLFHAAEDRWPGEEQLPFVKVLCGSDPADPFTLGPHLLDEEERQETELFRAAVSLHAGRDLAEVQELLARPGLLLYEDSGWLLRVPTYLADDALESLPWPLSWVRLPWMAEPLRVQWLAT